MVSMNICLVFGFIESRGVSRKWAARDKSTRGISFSGRFFSTVEVNHSVLAMILASRSYRAWKDSGL